MSQEESMFINNKSELQPQPAPGSLGLVNAFMNGYEVTEQSQITKVSSDEGTGAAESESGSEDLTQEDNGFGEHDNSN